MAIPAKLLVRAWLPGKGCVHLRSTAMTETEARYLLEAAVRNIEVAQESGRTEKVLLERGCAFVKAHRSPDPDQPGRTAPGFILVSIPDPDAFVREAVAREFDELLLFAADKVLDSAPHFEAASDLGLRGWKPLDLGGTPPDTGSGEWLPGGKRWLLGTSAAVLVLAASVGIIWHFLPKPSPNAESPPPDRTSPMVAGYDSKSEDWRLARQQIQTLLDKPWAMKRLGRNTSSPVNDGEFLSRFSLLFKRPDLKTMLKEKSFKYYELNEPSEHPFVAFLQRFPEKVPVKKIDNNDISPSEAMEFLTELGRKLEVSGIHLDPKNPEKLSQNATLSLDYNEFFQNWRRLHDSVKVPTEKWDMDREDDPAYKWVAVVRKLIQERYPQTEHPGL